MPLTWKWSCFVKRICVLWYSQIYYSRQFYNSLIKAGILISCLSASLSCSIREPQCFQIWTPKLLKALCIESSDLLQMYGKKDCGRGRDFSLSAPRRLFSPHCSEIFGWVFCVYTKHANERCCSLKTLWIICYFWIIKYSYNAICSMQC